MKVHSGLLGALIRKRKLLLNQTHSDKKSGEKKLWPGFLRQVCSLQDNLKAVKKAIPATSRVLATALVVKECRVCVALHKGVVNASSAAFGKPSCSRRHS